MDISILVSCAGDYKLNERFSIASNINMPNAFRGALCVQSIYVCPLPGIINKKIHVYVYVYVKRLFA